MHVITGVHADIVVRLFYPVSGCPDVMRYAGTIRSVMLHVFNVGVRACEVTMSCRVEQAQLSSHVFM